MDVAHACLSAGPRRDLREQPQAYGVGQRLDIVAIFSASAGDSSSRPSGWQHSNDGAGTSSTPEPEANLDMALC
jgi:hypothetical protein